MQTDNHTFTGLRRDSHPIKQDSKFLWEAHNIRLTSREGNTLSSITNEKSTLPLESFGDDKYVGHVTCGKYLVLFTHNEENDTVYRYDLDEEKYIILYRGDLNLNPDNPIQAISDFESEYIQKVYWTDGINRPRVINITKPELTLKKEGEELPQRDVYNEVYNDAPFDFVQELKLEENVSVKRIDGSVGIFQPGVIQYAFTYYYKYGQESNIFHVTEPLYVAFPTRGGEPDKAMSTSFEIRIDKPEVKFDYIRVYSILRTSLDAVPTVKRVMDIELDKNRNYEEPIIVIDNNTTNETVDPSMLLYIGGKDIVAQCMHNKDGVLFLGNIKYNRHELPSLEIDGKKIGSYLKEHFLHKNNEGIRDTLVNDISSNIVGNAGYKMGEYENQLTKYTAGFKVGETYRLGIQFQYKNGEWSEPVHIEDRVMDGWRPQMGLYGISLPMYTGYLNDTINNALINEGYIKARPVIAVPEYKDRTVIAQGILCPTVYNMRRRISNSPYAQSSWFLRPMLADLRGPVESEDPTEGEEAVYMHNFPLATGLSRSAEIQNMYLNFKNYDAEAGILGLIDSNTVREKILEGSNRYDSLYYVDQSILTFHSPDFVFNESLRLLIDSGQNLKIRLVGKVPFTENYGDIDIQTSSPTISSSARGFVHHTTEGDGGKSLISGLFYEDAIVDYKTNNSSGEFYEKFTKKDKSADDETISSLSLWMTYLWHRSGSLNNDVSRGSGQGTRTAELRKKKISNIKYSPETSWTRFHPLNTTKLELFDSNEIALVQLRGAKDEEGEDIDISYYGNVDALNSSNNEYRLVKSASLSQSCDTSIPWSFKIYQNLPKNKGLIYEGILSKYLGKGNIKIDRVVGNFYYGTITEYEGPDIFDDDRLYKEDLTGASVTIKSKKGFQYNQKQGNWFTYKEVTIEKDGEIIYTNNSGVHVPVNYEINIDVPKLEDAEEDGSLPNIDFGDKLTWLGVYDDKDKDNYQVGNKMSSLRCPKDPVRIKYKSTPHLVFAYLDDDNKPKSILEYIVDNNTLNDPKNAYLLMAEVYQDVDPKVRYGGTTDEALRNNLWIPAGEAVDLRHDDVIEWKWGDTWYQRYDLMKTYPFTNEDENQMIEIASFMCESRVNLDGRYDRNRFQKNNLDNSPQNFNRMNDVYSQLNKFFNYRMLDSDFYKVNNYPAQMLWTLVKNPAAETDNWTNLYSANSLDFDGTHGPLNAITSFSNLLVGFQNTAVNKISFNERVEIQSSDGVPIEIANNGRVEGYTYLSSSVGCSDKFSINCASTGIYFHDIESDAIYHIGEGIQNLSLSTSTLFWPRENHPSGKWTFGKSGLRIDSDPKYGDVYFIPADREYAFCYSEYLTEFVSEYSYGGAVLFPYNSELYSIAVDEETNELTLWKNFKGEGYNNIFNKCRDFDFSFISNDNPTFAKIFNTIDMRTDAYNGNSLIEDEYINRREDEYFESQPFSYIQVTNEYQNTGESLFNERSLRHKFRVWRAFIPRQEGARDRIINTWCKIKLGKRDTTENDFTILHDISVNYTV